MAGEPKRMVSKTATPLRRRDVLAGAGAAAFVAYAADKAHSQAAPRIGLPETLFADAGTLFNAQLGGHLRGAMAEAAIDVVRDSAAVIAGLRERRFAIGQILALELMRDAARAAEPLISVATLTRIPLYLHTRARWLSDTPARLAGRTIALPAEVAEADAYLSLYLARNGVEPIRVNRAEAARELEALDLMLSGKTHGAVFSPGYAGLINKGLRDRGMDHKKAGLVSRVIDGFTAPFPGLCFAATRDTIESQPALAADFVRGLLASAREQAAAHEAKNPVVEERLKRVAAPARTELRAFMLASVVIMPPLWLAARDRDRLLRHDPQRWAGGAGLLAKAGIADVTGNLDKLYTNRFVEEASRN